MAARNRQTVIQRAEQKHRATHKHTHNQLVSDKQAAIFRDQYHRYG